MEYKDLQKDLLVTIRGKHSQRKLSEKLGFEFNQVYRWESSRTLISWTDFVRFADISGPKLKRALEEAYSYFEKPADFARLTRHFVGKRKLSDVASEIGVSRYSLSRWLRGTHEPTLIQVLKLMYVGSVDFFRFIELLTGTTQLPSIREQLESEQAHLSLYARFPWLSVLFSALDLDDYRKTPTMAFLGQKTRLPVALVKEAIEALHEQDLLHWNGRHWETRIKRISLRGTLESRKTMAKYVLSRALDGVDPVFGTSVARFSWKLFSLNKKQLNGLLEKYTEFFNELGTLVDQGQKGADGVYLFSATFLDFEDLPEATEYLRGKG